METLDDLDSNTLRRYLEKRFGLCPTEHSDHPDKFHGLVYICAWPLSCLAEDN